VLARACAQMCTLCSTCWTCSTATAARCGRRPSRPWASHTGQDHGSHHRSGDGSITRCASEPSFLAASGELSGRLRGGSHGRRQACRQARRSAKPRRLACWSRWRCWPPSMVKPPLMTRWRGKRAGGVIHALGVPGAPLLREIRHYQGLWVDGALAVGRGQAHGQAASGLGLFSVNTLTRVNALTHLRARVLSRGCWSCAFYAFHAGTVV
jgi:hypothetical protein